MESKTDLFEEKINIITSSTFDKDVEGSISILTSQNFDIDIVNLHQGESYKTPVYKAENHIEIHFELQGILNYTSKFNQNLETLSGRYNFFYKPAIEGDIKFIPVNQKRRAVGIELSVDYLKSIFGGNMDILGDFWKNITSQKEDCWIENGIIDSYLSDIIYQIQNCKYEGVIKSIFFKSKVNELVAYIINQKKDKNYSYHISKSDVDRLYYACELIKNNFDDPLTLSEISSKIGMSESKLKRNFKSLFNIYWNKECIRLNNYC